MVSSSGAAVSFSTTLGTNASSKLISSIACTNSEQVRLIVALVPACEVLCYTVSAWSERCVMNDLTCPSCRNSALAYPTTLEDNQPVACARCGAFVSTYGELKRRAEGAPNLSPARLPVSGC
jgi:hypothetical protein